MTSSRPGSSFAERSAAQIAQIALDGGGGGERQRERSAYTRFIPREELEGAAVWTPGSLGEAFDGGAAIAPQAMPWHPLPGQEAGAAQSPLQAAARAAGVTLAPRPGAAPAGASSPPPPEPLLGETELATPDLMIQPAEPVAEVLSAQAEAQLADLQARLESEVAAARQAGYQDGYRDGLVALDSFKSSYAQQVTAQVGQVLQSLDGELRQLEQKAAASLARVAIALARQVVRSELTTHPALVAQVAQEAVNTVMTGARQITVKVHPDDHALVAQGCAETLTARGARLVAEATVARGGCLVDTEAGGVDARIASRWAAVMQTMGSAAPWQSDDDGPGGEA